MHESVKQQEASEPVYPSAEWLAWRKREMGIEPEPKVREVVAFPGPLFDGKYAYQIGK